MITGVNNLESAIKGMEMDFQQGNYQALIRSGAMFIEQIPALAKNLYVLYFMAKAYEKIYDFSKAAKYYLKILSLTENELVAGTFEIEIEVHVNTRIFFFVGLQAMGRGGFEEALAYFSKFLQYDKKNGTALYYAGLCCLYIGRIDDAIRYLNTINSSYADYAKLFAMGCAFQLKGKGGLAQDFYRQALRGYPGMKAAQYNLNVLVNAALETAVERTIWLGGIEDGTNISDYKKIPIFINSRDRIDCLKQLIGWLLQHNYCNIYVLDNDSTYPPLLDYYKTLETVSVKVIFLQENTGHQSLWKANILERLQINTPYVYTDPDVLPLEECPEDFMLYMLKLLRQNSTIQKIGLGLRINDVPQANFPENERQFWELEFAPNLYYAYTDTTFALYRAGRRFYINESIRMGYPYMARHLPWYYDKTNLPADEAYYIRRANASSTYAKNHV